MSRFITQSFSSGIKWNPIRPNNITWRLRLGIYENSSEKTNASHNNLHEKNERNSEQFAWKNERKTEQFAWKTNARQDNLHEKTNARQDNLHEKKNARQNNVHEKTNARQNNLHGKTNARQNNLHEKTKFLVHDIQTVANYFREPLWYLCLFGAMSFHFQRPTRLMSFIIKQDTIESKHRYIQVTNCM